MATLVAVLFLLAIVLESSDRRVWTFRLDPTPQPPYVNWTATYDPVLAEMAMDFAAAAYADDPTPCLRKHGAVLVEKLRAPCDYIKDEVGFRVSKVCSVQGHRRRNVA